MISWLGKSVIYNRLNHFDILSLSSLTYNKTNPIVM